MDTHDRLKPGLAHILTYTVPSTKTVPSLYPEAPEFQAMPDVFATGFLVGLVEWACLRAVMPHLDWPREQTVGTHVDLSHLAATPPGCVVTVEARLVAVDGRRLVFEAQASDGVDVISRGRHERHLIDRRRFEARVARKAPPAATPPIRVREIDHVVLRVRELGTMLRFYRDALGCAVERDRPELGLVQLRAGRSLIDLVPVDGPIGQRGGPAPGVDGHNLDHFCLRVHPFDADAIRDHLLAFGCTPGELRPRYGADGEGPSLYVQDPEGNSVELKGPPISGPVGVPGP